MSSCSQRVVRIGVKALPAVIERTFRLFIEKIPSSSAPLQQGATVAINVRFALPIFVQPSKASSTGEIAALELSRGALAATITNTGNTHLLFDSGLDVRGKNAQGVDIFTSTINDRYVLAGVSKRFSLPIPYESCAQLASLELTAKSDTFTLSRTLDVDRQHCK